jgi:hypothetical protein
VAQRIAADIGKLAIDADQSLPRALWIPWIVFSVIWERL